MSLQATVPQFQTAFDHCVIAVSDFELANEFYRDVIGVTVLSLERGFAYKLGAIQFNVHGPGMDPKPLAATPVAPGGSHLCFRWNGTVEEAIAHLERKGVLIEDGPVSRTGAEGEGTSIYFRDPDGSLLEFITYQEN
ncbi:MAG: VOC family protein [Actinomycetota bacterium]|nr:VOC family protein [Actinomycetota bacterium]